MFLKVLNQYTNKSVLWRKNLFISSLLKGFSKILLGTTGKAWFVISVKAELAYLPSFNLFHCERIGLPFGQLKVFSQVS